MHQLNLDRLPETIKLAQVGCKETEIANVQYHGWAALNKNLMPTQEQSDRTNQIVKGPQFTPRGPVTHRLCL